ncbi:hypothetical protein QO002_004643 [Pararhizobium capsulatum DSM 1112]|uniref:Uncharacterized protein n=1 Tax=Pararhizobium capsulatum DSM 1112 TaxID=1121113 RepID=A0ABU0BW02_9HYPH|nr:hypothetical protein [Pararhizobium capsulatum DSM 1112]
MARIDAQSSASDWGEDFDWRDRSGLSFRLRGTAVINCMGITSRFRADGLAGFPSDNFGAHPVWRLTIAKVAISVKPSGPIVDRQRKEHACDACGQKLAHGEHVTAIEERRHDLEHVVVVGFRYLKPLADVARAIYPIIVERRLAVAVEQGIHFVAAGHTFEHLTDSGRNEHLRLLRGCD